MTVHEGIEGEVGDFGRGKGGWEKGDVICFTTLSRGHGTAVSVHRVFHEIDHALREHSQFAWQGRRRGSI